MSNTNGTSRKKKEKASKQTCANWTYLSIGSELAKSISKSTTLIRSSRSSTKLGKMTWKKTRRKKKPRVSMLMDTKTISPRQVHS